MKMWHIIWFELRKLIRMPVVIFNLFLMPMVLIFILGNALSGTTSLGNNAPIDSVTAMIVEPPGSKGLMSFGWNEFLENPDIKELLKIQYGVSREEAETDLKSGKIDFAAIVPSDFADKARTGETVKWEMILGMDQSKNLEAQMILDSYLDEVNRVQAAIRVLGSNSLTTTAQHIPGSNVEMATLNKKGNSYSSFQYYAASILIMFLLYSGITASNSLHAEKMNKTLYRLNSMPVSTLNIFLGKICGNGLVAFFQALVIIFGTTWLYGVNWGGHPLYLLLICVLVVIASMLIAIIVTLMSRSSGSAQTIIQVIIIVMTFLSGGFQPIPIDIIEKLSKFTVNHWALQGIIRIMLNASRGEILLHVFMLAIFSAVLLLVGMLFYRKVGYHE